MAGSKTQLLVVLVELGVAENGVGDDLGGRRSTDPAPHRRVWPRRRRVAGGFNSFDRGLTTGLTSPDMCSQAPD